MLKEYTWESKQTFNRQLMICMTNASPISINRFKRCSTNPLARADVLVVLGTNLK